MKPSPWLIPVLAALAVGGWIVARKATASALERDITDLRERIQSARAAADSNDQPREADAKPGTAKSPRVNWKEMAASFSNGPDDLRSIIRMQRLLMDLTAEDLCAQLDEIARLEVDDRVRHHLQGMISVL